MIVALGTASKRHHMTRVGPPATRSELWAVLTFGEIKQEVHSQVYHAGEMDFCEKLDTVHFWCLVGGLAV